MAIRFLRAAALLLLVLGALAGACGRPAPPVHTPLVERPERRVAVLVPGVTGSALRDVESGELIWGLGAHLLRPRDGGYAVARPLWAAPGESAGIEPAGVIEELGLLGGLIRKQIYGPVMRTLEANGYRRGDLGRPDPEADLFAYAYDWRDDLVASATRLAERLDRLRRARRSESLEVDLVCQSAGGQICRYLAKYGGASLDGAEAGETRPSSLRVAKVILVGTSNGGGIRILREMHRGRSYVPGIGRRMRPEVLFSFASLFQDLPVYRTDLFVDSNGDPVDVDLMDPSVWPELELSIFAPESRERIERRGAEEIFGDEALRRAAVTRFLDRSRRLHTLLRRDVARFDTRYYSIQNVGDPTPDRAVLAGETPAERSPLFAGDRELRRRPALSAAVTASGDGHATETSQRWLSPQERAALAATPLHLDGDHFAMILDPRALDGILRYLAD